ncbi:dipeptidase PepV [Ligilactobacillus ceti]|uniref:Xaa-His dipeptidase n=1 Tax=Ligilactobacillus ceti DSM 22408 TaxID=1122146 RepID=A0A0R2KGK7_9LACO|nr:dipeptidase PepV [Ligilactobacillus ceti]KRN88494.1 Xaa-His dipeptidase [Ligilactobacillus ceti DSM 22408]
MSIDWKLEVEKRKEDLLADLFTMLKIESVRDESIATAEAPLGPGPKIALDKFLEIAERDGFETLELDGLAGHIEFGEGDETLGVLAHVDVMPAGKGWDTDPFEPVIINDRIYARGSSDDKGPGIAAYYGLKIIKELGLPVSKKVRFIIGTDEESSWRGMTHYMEKMPKPDFAFSPDAFFPIINGEKGIASIELKYAGTNGDAAKLISFESGLRTNMVPRDAEAVVEGLALADVEPAFAEFVAANPITGEIVERDGQLFLSVIGKAAHAQEPRLGENAGTYLATFLNQFNFGGAAANFIKVASENLHGDSRAKGLGLEFTDEIMGDLTVNPGIFKFVAGEEGSITLNFRYPKGIDVQEILAGLEKLVAPMDVTLTLDGHAQEPHYVSPEDPIVKTLLGVYNKQTGSNETGKVVGGGTYGRLLERGVAFGALFPETENTMHQANEYMPLSDLFRSAAIYAESIYELIK